MSTYWGDCSWRGPTDRLLAWCVRTEISTGGTSATSNGPVHLLSAQWRGRGLSEDHRDVSYDGGSLTLSTDGQPYRRVWWAGLEEPIQRWPQPANLTPLRSHEPTMGSVMDDQER